MMSQKKSKHSWRKSLEENFKTETEIVRVLVSTIMHMVPSHGMHQETINRQILNEYSLVNTALQSLPL